MKADSEQDTRKTGIGRIGLGTVQFGQHYGITNKVGQPGPAECYRIIDKAYEAGIRVFDTAAYYGHASVLLANGLSDKKHAKVVTKVRTKHDLHHAKVLFGGQLYAVLGDIKRDEFPRVGRSIYWTGPDPTSIDLVQLPLSTADRRNLSLVDLYKSHGVEVHARSIFLQGLLLERGATIRQCLKFVLSQSVDIALVGVNTLDELKQIIEAVETLDEETDDFVPFIEPDMLDPRTWRR